MNDWLMKISPCLRLSGSLRHKTGWVEPLRVIYDHELLIVSQGGVTVEIQGKAYDCPANSFIIIPPGVWHVCSDAAGQSGCHHWVHFNWSYQNAVSDIPVMSFHPGKPRPDLYQLAPGWIPKPILHGPIRSPSYTLELHARLCEKFNHGNQHDRLVCRAIVLELLLTLLDSESRPDDELNSTGHLVGKVRLQLEKISRMPVNDCPSIQSMLEELGYSYAHLCRLFRQAYGITPLGYVNALRLERAKLLLRDTELTISQIACRVGFDNPAYFSRLFKKQIMMSPREFINHTRK